MNTADSESGSIRVHHGAHLLAQPVQTPKNERMQIRIEFNYLQPVEHKPRPPKGVSIQSSLTKHATQTTKIKNETRLAAHINIAWHTWALAST